MGWGTTFVLQHGKTCPVLGLMWFEINDSSSSCLWVAKKSLERVAYAQVLLEHASTLEKLVSLPN